MGTSPSAPRYVLGLESGGEHLGVALVDAAAGALVDSVTQLRVDKTQDHLLELVADALSRHSLSLADIALIAVGRGPGSFTGIRIGLSVAAGLSLGSGVPVWPVSSLAALAMNVGVPGVHVLALLDAKRGEVYGGLYRLGDKAPEVVVAPRVATCESVAAQARATLEAEAIGTGPGDAGRSASELTATQLIVLGSGAQAFGVASPLATSLHVPSAAMTATLALWEWLGADRDMTLAPPIDPMYLRRSEAEVAADARDGELGVPTDLRDSERG
ncbi:MAG: tRNA (adenosine(37)-N6)-threonylcarbamoyltransferase complex dimerization subunit type 1 TsaB [Deltaproteobacteria bacterium]|nr:tRNA (adenosine(37)-N6)-threonylcarbamoyltransferase complex dimerization subunit type 1 TsaB [Deltaproteobacteria bacterium]